MEPRQDGLKLCRLSVLVSAAIPVTVLGFGRDGWLTFVASARRFEPGNEIWLGNLTRRQRDLLLPEYVSRYWTVLLCEESVVLRSEAGDLVTEGTLTVFVSLIRERFLCVSLWLGVESSAPIVSPERLSSAWTSDFGLEFSAESGLAGLVSSVDGRSSGSLQLTTTDCPSLMIRAATALFDGHVIPDHGSSPLHPDARFDATIAALCEVPEGFGRSDEPGAPPSSLSPDWLLHAAELLPVVHGSQHEYRPEFLLDALGTDVMDSAAGHYFLGRRRVLALLDGADPSLESRLLVNTLTWTQLLCENASIQLAAIRTNNQRLQAEIDRRRSLAQAARSLTRSQYNLYRDLDEAQNVAVSLDPVFWHHQEALKNISGLSALAASLSERSHAFASMSSLEEQRTLASATQTLTVVLSAVALVAVTVQVALSEDWSIRTVALLAVAAAVLGGGIGFILLAVMKRVGGRMSRGIGP